MSRTRFLSRVAVFVVGLAAGAVIAAVSPHSGGALPAGGMIAALHLCEPPLPPDVVVVFCDDMEHGVNDWEVWTESVGGVGCPPNEWHQTDPALFATDAHSGERAWTNNPYSPAGITACLNHLISPPIDTPAGAPNLMLTFWERHFSEECSGPLCDYGEVQITTDAGFTWTKISTGPCAGVFHGGPTTYTQASCELKDFYTAGQTIYLRFKFSSDQLVASPPFQGWYIDDVKVWAPPPTAVSIASFTARASGRTGVKLSWRTASENEVLGYNVWRYAAGKGVKVNRTLVAARGWARGATYSLVDRQARPGVAYTYRLQLVSKDGRRIWSARTAVRVKR